MNNVGFDIYNQAIGDYQLEAEYIDGTLNNQNIIPVVIPIIGYDPNNPFPATLVDGTIPIPSSTAPVVETHIELENNDATGIVDPVNGTTRLQQQFGGYYNYQKISSTNTGIFNINEVNSGDCSKYVLQPNKENIIKLTQNTNDGQAYVKSINYLLGHAPTFNISPDTNPQSVVASATTNTALFGVLMPNNSISFSLSNFRIDDINVNWIWPEPEKLMKFKVKYSGNLLGELQEDWSGWPNPTIIPQFQQKTFTFTESVAQTTDTIRTSYKYSRDGNEGELTSTGGLTSDAQFEIQIECKNNLFATPAAPSAPIKYDIFKHSNNDPGVPVDDFDWGVYITSAPNPAIPRKHILWWDYTYNGITINNGTLPDGLITGNSSTIIN